MPSRRSNRPLAAMTAGLFIGLVLVGAAILGQGRNDPPDATTEGRGVPGNGPCAGAGTATTLATAEETASYTLFVPSDGLASSDSLKTTWQCAGSEVEEDFSSGVVVYQDQNSISDPASAWKAMASDSPSDTTVGTALGQPAALIEPKAGNNGSVTVVYNGTWIVVEGNGSITIDDLLNVVNSLEPASSSGTT